MANSVQDDNSEDDTEEPEESTLEQLFEEGYQQDPFPNKVL